MDGVNYIIEINALDVWELTHPLSATAYKVMRKLQYLANQERFPERIHVSNRVLMSMVGCSEDSLDKARKQLINFGLIEYKGQKKMTPLYMLHYFSHNPIYNPKIAGYEQGIKQDIEQGIKQDIEQGIKQETYINKTYKTYMEEDEEDNTANIARVRAKDFSDQQDEPCRGIVYEWQKSFGEIPAPAIIRKIGGYETDFPIDVIQTAIRIAAERNAGSPADYATALLENWCELGLETNEDIERYFHSREISKTSEKWGDRLLEKLQSDIAQRRVEGGRR